MSFSKTLIAVIAFAFVAYTAAFQEDEVLALKGVHDQIGQNLKNKEFTLYVKDLLFSLISRKTHISHQIQEQLRGPLAEIQKAEQAFIEATQSTDPNHQAVVDQKFKELTDIQEKYDDQIHDQSRSIQILGIESELAEDLLLRNYALESCMLRRDNLELRLRANQQLSAQDLQDERRSLAISQEEIDAEQNLVGEGVVQQQEKYCANRGAVLQQSIATLLQQIEAQNQQQQQQQEESEQ